MNSLLISGAQRGFKLPFFLLLKYCIIANPNLTPQTNEGIFLILFALSSLFNLTIWFARNYLFLELLIAESSPPISTWLPLASHCCMVGNMQFILLLFFFAKTKTLLQCNCAFACSNCNKNSLAIARARHSFVGQHILAKLVLRQTLAS